MEKMNRHAFHNFALFDVQLLFGKKVANLCSSFIYHMLSKKTNEAKKFTLNRVCRMKDKSKKKLEKQTRQNL